MVVERPDNHCGDDLVFVVIIDSEQEQYSIHLLLTEKYYLRSLSHLVQENPTNCGSKASDVLGNFIAGKLLCESTEYFIAFATTMTSQRLSIQSVAPSATVWPLFKTGVLRSQFWWLGEC